LWKRGIRRRAQGDFVRGVLRILLAEGEVDGVGGLIDVEVQTRVNHIF
jgi:hypothetical protein